MNTDLLTVLKSMKELGYEFENPVYLKDYLNWELDNGTKKKLPDILTLEGHIMEMLKQNDNFIDLIIRYSGLVDSWFYAALFQEQEQVEFSPPKPLYGLKSKHKDRRVACGRMWCEVKKMEKENK